MWEALWIGAIFVLGTIALAWAAYFGMRAVAAQRIETDTRELAGSVIFRVSALHGLILALVFAQEMLEYQRLRTGVIEEATAVADIYWDIGRYGTEKAPEIRKDISQYLSLAAGEEWEKLGADGRMLSEAWATWELVYHAILDLEPATPRQESLRAHMLRDVQLIAERRQARENSALNTISGMFWFAAIAGVFLISLPYFSFPPTQLNLLLLTVYGAFTGLVMLFIYAFSNPFAPPGNVAPVAFERLLEGDIGRGA